jgi:dynamin 1-like protein
MIFKTEPEILEELLKESPDIVARRKECVKMVGALNQAEAMYVHISEHGMRVY